MNEQQLPPLPKQLELLLADYWDAGYDEGTGHEPEYDPNATLAQIRDAIRDCARAALAANAMHNNNLGQVGDINVVESKLAANVPTMLQGEDPRIEPVRNVVERLCGTRQSAENFARRILAAADSVATPAPAPEAEPRSVAAATEILAKVWLLGWRSCRDSDADADIDTAWANAEWEVKKTAAPLILAAKPAPAQAQQPIPKGIVLEVGRCPSLEPCDCDQSSGCKAGQITHVIRSEAKPEAQQPKPLTDEQIMARKPASADFVSFRAGVRCMEIERASGEASK